MCAELEISYDGFIATANRLGPEFDLHGHHFKISPKIPRPDPDYVPDPEYSPRGPYPSPLEIAIRARKLYDEQGIARVGLLARKPAQ
jgi:hypothetical protein